MHMNRVHWTYDIDDDVVHRLDIWDTSIFLHGWCFDDGDIESDGDGDGEADGGGDVDDDEAHRLNV